MHLSCILDQTDLLMVPLLTIHATPLKKNSAAPLIQFNKRIMKEIVYFSFVGKRVTPIKNWKQQTFKKFKTFSEFH